MKENNKEKIRFLIVGAGNTLIGYFIYFLIIFLFNLSYDISMFLTILLSVYIGYYTHKKITFKRNGLLNKYILIAIFIYFINLTNKYLLTFFFSLEDKYLLGLITITISIPISYFLNSKYVFKK